jgi:hypothetical protein
MSGGRSSIIARSIIAAGDVLDEDVEVVPALPWAELGVHLRGLRVHQPGLQQLPVAGEQGVGQRAVAPEDPVPVQVDQEADHGVEQPGTVAGTVGGQPHEQAAELPGPVQVAGDEHPVVVTGLQGEPRSVHGGQALGLERPEHRVLVQRDPLRLAP